MWTSVNAVTREINSLQGTFYFNSINFWCSDIGSDRLVDQISVNLILAENNESVADANMYRYIGTSLLLAQRNQVIEKFYAKLKVFGFALHRFKGHLVFRW